MDSCEYCRELNKRLSDNAKWLRLYKKALRIAFDGDSKRIAELLEQAEEMIVSKRPKQEGGGQ